MASTILYKFRSGTTFEALPLSGSSARLLDIKKAIVQAKKLDYQAATNANGVSSSSLEFDLSVRDATTQQEYVDENMLLPRGTRVIVQRLPAARGHGFVARMARLQQTGVLVPPTTGMQQQQSQFPMQSSSFSSSSNAVAHNNSSSSFYTIDGRAHDHDEFVMSSSSQPKNNNGVMDDENTEEREVAALRAAMDAGSGNPSSQALSSMSSSSSAAFPPLQRGHRPFSGSNYHHNSNHNNHYPTYNRFRPNADPEIREYQDKFLQHQQPKKRAAGIPRTFLSLSLGTGGEDGEGGIGGGGGISTLLQPNAIGFEDLVNRKGGLSENTSGTKRDLEYALKVTATIVPEYLQCAICHGVVTDAVILPWDPEGRTTHESCIRNALNESGFRCPLTGQEGVSPDDILPNMGLRRAAEQFVKTTFDQLAEIELQKVVYDDEDGSPSQGIISSSDAATENGSTLLLQNENEEKGVVVTHRHTDEVVSERTKREDDLFGRGDADFGGDVFLVPVVTEARKDKVPVVETTVAEKPSEPSSPQLDPVPAPPATVEVKDAILPNLDDTSAINNNIESKDEQLSPAAGQATDTPNTGSPNSVERHHASGYSKRREAPPSRRRGPPMGYSMGPAGFGAIIEPAKGASYSSPRENASPGQGDRGGRTIEGRLGRGGGRSSYTDYRENALFVFERHEQQQQEFDTRGEKRTRSSADDNNQPLDDDSEASTHRDWQGRDNSRAPGRVGGRGRGGARWGDRGGREGGYRGGGGRWEDRGGRAGDGYWRGGGRGVYGRGRGRF